MLVIGHRGAASLAPENTMETLQMGLESGADILDFDVRLPKDKIPVLIHDFHTIRTHHDVSFISRLTLADLENNSKLAPIITLENVLDEFFGKIILNIELKGRGTAEIVFSLVKSHIKKTSDWDNIIFSSFKGSRLRIIRKLSKKARLALLHGQNPFIFIAYHRQLNLTAVGFHRLYINKLALEIAKKAGIFTYAYTVNRPQTAVILAGQGIDGVVTDNPKAILKELFSERQDIHE
mgnify:CR=1 FL=1